MLIMLRFTLYFLLFCTLLRNSLIKVNRTFTDNQRSFFASVWESWSRPLGSQRAGDLVVNLEVECYYLSPGARLVPAVEHRRSPFGQYQVIRPTSVRQMLGCGHYSMTVALFDHLYSPEGRKHTKEREIRQ